MINQYKFTLNDYERETTLDGALSLIIYQSSQKDNIKVDFSDGITGYLGIQPFTANFVQQNNSFLY